MFPKKKIIQNASRSQRNISADSGVLFFLEMSGTSISERRLLFDSVPEEAFFFLTLCFQDADVIRFFLVSEEVFVFLLLSWPLEILVGFDVDIFSSFV